MPPEAAPVAAPAAPAVPAAPAAPPVVLGGPALSHAAAADKVRAGFKVDPAQPVVAPAPAAAPPPAIRADADLKDLTRLSSENRALQQKVRELEPAAKDAALLKEVRDLYSGGKKIAAIGKLAGADPTGEMEALLADYLKDPNDPAVIDKLGAKIDERANAIDAATKAAEAQASAAEHAKAATGVVGSQIAARLDKLPHTAKADRADAISKVISAVTRLRESKGLSVEASTPEVMQSILAEAIDEVEIEYEVRAVRAARAVPGQPSGNQPPVAASPAPAAGEPAPSIESLERPGVSVAEWGKTLTHDKAKEKFRAMLRQGTP